MNDELAARLPEVLQPLLGETSVANLRLLTGGASRTTWAFDAGAGGGRTAASRRELPPSPSCELVLAVACGELASGSPHAEPRRQAFATRGCVAWLIEL